MPAIARAHILLAEDDPDIRQVTCDLLELSGYVVTAVGGGQQAQAAFDRECPDLVLADISMPEGDGFELLRHIRAHRAASDVPVIFITGKAALNDVRAGLRDGVDDYVTKPFEPSELLRSIAGRIERREQRLRQLEQLKLTISRTVPHEVRTALCGILGYAELLRDAASGGTAVPAAEVAEAAEAQILSCGRLTRLIDVLGIWAELSTSGPEMVRAYAAARSVDWELVAELNCREIARRFGRETDLEVSLEPAVVALPESHWQMLISQLVDNAFKFSRRGAAVRVKGERQGEQYRCTVRNAGTCDPARNPMGPGGQPAVTDEPAAERRAPGLGLAIARQVAALGGADFRLTSADGQTEASIVLRGAGRSPGQEPVAPGRSIQP